MLLSLLFLLLLLLTTRWVNAYVTKDWEGGGKENESRNSGEVSVGDFPAEGEFYESKRCFAALQIEV